MAGAVSKAGGLGMIGVGPARSRAYVEEQAAVARSAGRPYGIGLLAWAVEQDPAPLEATLASDAALVSVSFGNFEEPLQRLKAAGKLVTTQVGNLRGGRRAEAAGVDFDRGARPRRAAATDATTSAPCRCCRSSSTA